MSKPDAIEKLLTRMARNEWSRIVGFGSSNTEARAGLRFNWLDWLDTGLHRQYGRVHRTINAGVSGNTTGQMLERFDHDLALYQPHFVIITAGGNDAAPEKTKGEDVYRANLTSLVKQCQALEAGVLLQTYYAVDLGQLEPAYAEAFPRYMQIIREVTEETQVPLFDHYARWEPLRQTDLTRYRSLMIDPLHVNPLGNSLMGVDLLRLFGIALDDELQAALQPAVELQRRLDSLTP